jgi:hypothetical protein
MTTPLRVLHGRPSPTVTIQRHLVVGAAMNAEALAADLESALGGIAACMWAGNRPGAINQIGRAHLRIEELRAAFLELAGIADRAPTEPTTTAALRVA